MTPQAISEALSAWRDYAKARERLKMLQYCRSNKDPEAEFAEWLVAHLVDGKLVDNKSHPAYDVVQGDRRIQVRKYGKAPGNKNPIAISLYPGREEKPTHFAIVEYQDGIPFAVYVCTYEWIRLHQVSDGLNMSTLREAANRNEIESRWIENDLRVEESVESDLNLTDLPVNDPVLRLLGTVTTKARSVSEHHDEYLGQALLAELRDEVDE